MAKKNRIIDADAIRFLLEQQIRTLPVNAIKLANKKGYKLFSYSGIVSIVEKIGYCYEDIVICFGHAFASYDEQFKTYIIACDMKCNPFVRNWAILHEIAHIEQGHIEAQRMTLLNERSIMNEINAEKFVKMVLCPDPVLNEIEVNLPDDIERVCFVPKERAIEKAKAMDARKIDNYLFGNKMKALEIQLKQKFSSYIKLFRREEMSSELFPYDELAEMRKRIS